MGEGERADERFGRCMGEEGRADERLGRCMGEGGRADERLGRCMGENILLFIFCMLMFAEFQHVNQL